ncbi:MAG TPA: hypothetical protein VGK00_08965 [Anaerolineales bacterium]|jgi:hypothetical protein
MKKLKLFVAVLITVLVVVATFAPALADTPQATIVPVDVTFTNSFDCAFPLVESVRGALIDTLFFDQNGILVREFLSPQFQGALNVTWTNPVTGRTLTSHQASPLTIYYNPDGSFKSLSNEGLTFMVVVPGAGKPVLVDVGRIVIQRGQGFTLLAGVHQELFGDTGAFCNYLAGF